MKKSNNLRKLFYKAVSLFLVAAIIWFLFSLFYLAMRLEYATQQAAEPIYTETANGIVMSDSGKMIFNVQVVMSGALLLGGLAIFIFIFIRWISKTIFQPLEELSGGIEHVSQSNYTYKIAEDAKYELGEIQAEFNNMSTRLEELEAEQQEARENKARMFSHISHDLRTPITSLKAYIEALENAMIPEEKLSETYALLNKKCATLNTMIDDIFLLSKMDTQGYELDEKLLDINEWLRTLAASYYAEFEEQKFDVHYLIDEHQEELIFDPYLLERAIRNIIDNALKYCDEGTRLSFYTKKADGNFLIEIENDGPQISKKVAASIFEPFYREDVARKTEEGSGLGLSITAEIVRMHGGEVSLETEPFTKFTIKLPMKGN